MPSPYQDRVKDQTNTTGTDAFVIDGIAPVGYRTIASVYSDGNPLRYTAISADGTQWEVGQGVWTSSSNTLSRLTPYASSSGGNKVNFSAGAKAVFIGPVAQDLIDIVTNYATLASPAFTGTPTAPTAAADTNTTQIATTAYVVGQGYLKGNQNISVSGDASGSGTTSISLTLANSGVTAGTYGDANNIPSFTVDAKGRITGVTNTAVNIPSGSLTFTGDVTGSGTTGSSTALTLAASGVSAGTYGDANNIPSFTVDSKGRITGVTNTAVNIPSGSLTFTGDVTGSGTTGSSTALTLANSGVSAGTYTKVTVNAKGLVTTGASLASSDVTTALGFTPENAANRGAANGYAPLGSDSKVPSLYLPSYVDDVLEYANLAAFPGTGETGKIYVTLDTNKTYRWSGSAYVEISASPGTTDSLTEGSVNLYFTQARARSSISVTQNLSYNSTTGVITGPDLSGYLTSSTAASTYLTTSSAASTYLKIDGSTSMTGSLTVFGVAGAAFQASYSGNSSNYALLQNSSGNFYVGRDTTTGGQFGVANAHVLFGTGASNPMVFFVAADEKMRIAPSTGALLVATKTDDGVNKLQVGGGFGLAGNIAFSGTGLRITGDFSNATLANRVMVQTSTANGNTVFSVLPNGTSVNSQFNLYGGSDAANAPLGALTINSGALQIQSTQTGTASTLPFRLLIGSTEVFRASTGFNLLVGTTTDDGVNKLQVTGSASFSSSVTASSFSGAGTGLTGTAASLSIGGNAATVTSITSSQVTTALGYTPLSNAGGTLTGVLEINPSAAAPSGGTSLTLGRAIGYKYIQSWGSEPLNFNPAGNAVQVAGNVVLHAGNYTSYSPSLTGTGASGTWGINISGNAATVNNGVYTTGSYSDPAWITALNASKLTGTIADARLSGGTYTINITGNVTGNITGNITANVYRDQTTTATVSSGSYSVDLSTRNTFILTIASNVTLTFANPPSGSNVTSFTIITVNDGTAGRALSFPASVTWAGGQTPSRTTTANKRDAYTFFTYDGGTSYIGSLAIKDF